MNDPVSSRHDPGLRITWRVTADAVIVTVLGEVDMDTAPDLDDALLRASEHATEAVPVVLDLHGVQFLGSAGLGVMLMWHRRCHATGLKLVVVAPPRPVARVLRITGLNKVFTVVPDLSAWSRRAD